MSEILVSYIIPIYNAEKTIHQCIDSIINQTYPNLEIILVNDGSTDKTGEICESYSSFDDRIIVYHSNNIGPGGARNIGIDMATGQYICFADADDYVSEREVEILVDLIENNQIDSIQFGFKHFENGSISHTGNVSDLFPFDTVIEKNTIVENLPIILGGWTVVCMAKHLSYVNNKAKQYYVS